MARRLRRLLALLYNRRNRRGWQAAWLVGWGAGGGVGGLDTCGFWPIRSCLPGVSAPGAPSRPCLLVGKYHPSLSESDRLGLVLADCLWCGFLHGRFERASMMTSLMVVWLGATFLLACGQRLTCRRSWGANGVWCGADIYGVVG